MICCLWHVRPIALDRQLPSFAQNWFAFEMPPQLSFACEHMMQGREGAHPQLQLAKWQKMHLVIDCRASWDLDIYAASFIHYADVSLYAMWYYYVNLKLPCIVTKHRPWNSELWISELVRPNAPSIYSTRSLSTCTGSHFHRDQPTDFLKPWPTGPVGTVWKHIV